MIELLAPIEDRAFGLLSSNKMDVFDGCFWFTYRERTWRPRDKEIIQLIWPFLYSEHRRVAASLFQSRLVLTQITQIFLHATVSRPATRLIMAGWLGFWHQPYTYATMQGDNVASTWPLVVMH